MSEYTPTTGHVRVAYQDHRDFQAAVRDLDRPGDVEAGREFDRWLARHDAEVKVEAWREYAAALEEVPDYAPTEYDKGRVDQRHAAIEELHVRALDGEQ